MLRKNNNLADRHHQRGAISFALLSVAWLQLTIAVHQFEHVAGYVEYFGEIKTGGESDEHSMGAGLSWFFFERLIQLDFSGGGGLNSAAPDWFVSAGVSTRFWAPWAKWLRK